MLDCPLNQAMTLEFALPDTLFWSDEEIFKI
jgi:hypothetical protein